MTATTPGAIFAFPNRVDATYVSVAFSGGSWQAALPLTNLRDPLLQKVSRSTDAALISTLFTVDLGAPRAVKVLAVPKSTLSQAALYKITGAADSGFTDIKYAGSWTDVWTTLYPFQSLSFQDPSWWTGKIPAEDAANYPWPLVVVLDTPIIARYWKFEFDDTTNAAGYVDLARLVIAPGWQPTINISYGAQLGWSTGTVAKESLGGVVYFDVRANRRVLNCGIDYLPLTEALVNMFEMQRALGIDQQFMFVYDPTDATNLARRSFLATLTNIGSDPITEIMYAAAQVKIEAMEVK